MSSNESLEKLMKRYSDELYKYNSIRKSKPSSFSITNNNATNTVTASSQNASLHNEDDEYITETSISLSEASSRIATPADSYQNRMIDQTSNADDEYITEVNFSMSETPPRTPFQPETPSTTSERRTESNSPTKDGKILVQVFTARRTMPIPNAYVDIYYSSNPTKKVVNTLITDDAGKTDSVVVPAMPKELSEQPQAVNPYTTYNITVSHPDFADVSVKNVSVFEGITAVLDIDMMPTNVAPNGESNDYVVIEPSDL